MPIYLIKVRNTKYTLEMLIILFSQLQPNHFICFGIRRTSFDFIISSKIKKLNYEYKWHSDIGRTLTWPIKKEQRRMRKKRKTIQHKGEQQKKYTTLNVTKSKMVKIMSLIVSNWYWNAISLSGSGNALPWAMSNSIERNFCLLYCILTIFSYGRILFSPIRCMPPFSFWTVIFIKLC